MRPTSMHWSFDGMVTYHRWSLKWRENEEMEIEQGNGARIRKWRERYTAFVASVAKVLTYAFWGNNSGSKQLARKPYNWCRPGWTWRACWRERCRSRRCGKLFWTGGGADTTSGVGPFPWTHRGGKLKHFSTHLWKACTCFWWWRLRKVQKKEKRSQQLWGKGQGWGLGSWNPYQTSKGQVKTLIPSVSQFK